MKAVIVKLLVIIRDFYKTRCEQSTWEQDRDTYSKWHDQIIDMIKTIENGGIK